MNAKLRLAFWIGLLCMVTGAIAAQRGMAVPTPPEQAIPQLMTPMPLQTQALSGRLFEPFLSYGVTAGGRNRTKTPTTPPPDLHLCTTLPNSPPIAIFQLGSAYQEAFQGGKVGDLTVTEIGEGYVRLEEGTLLMAIPCGEGEANPSVASGSDTQPGVPAGSNMNATTTIALPQSGGVLVTPQPAPAFATPTPYNPTMFGQPVQQQQPAIGPLYPGQTPPPANIIPPPSP